MQRLQYWFDQIIGIAQLEEERRAFAREVFSTRRISEETLALPACWRRAPKISLSYNR
jgi:hypothetical protein